MLARVLVIAIVLTMGVVAHATADSDPSIPSYYSQLKFNLTSPSARSTAIGGFVNPAVYGTLPGLETQFAWSDRNNRFRTLKEWGLFIGGRKIGFGMVRNELPRPGGGEIAVNDYRIGLADGSGSTTFGIGYGWSGGDDDLAGRSDVFQAGFVHRLGRHVSLGVAGNFAIEKSYQSGLFDAAVRPFGDERLTLFADAELPKDVSSSDAPWSVGAMVEVIPGLQIAGRFFDDDSYAVSVGFSFGGLRLAASPRYDKDNNTTNTTYEIRSGYFERSLLGEALSKDKGYLKMNLKGVVKHRGYRFFDSESHPLLRILDDLEKAKEDPAISGVAISLSGATMSRGKAWEIREKLAELQAAGKHVILFVDEINMTVLHLSSVADRVVMDPEGIALIPGYVMGRTFVRDLLAKVGIGFDEWRFLKYKSAAEMLSRDSMSEADREQRLELIEDLYATVRADVTEGRNVDAETFDRWINDQILITPKQALDAGIVDKLGRWEDMKDVIKEVEGGGRRYVGRNNLMGHKVPSQLWGESPKIAVVYGLGACEMDEGINARKLERVFLRLRDDRSVDAVVFRVDSPGGLAIAADLVAVAMKKCAEEKPVIVSQGDVAASGGYWLSMYADQIYAQPSTIVGSIGVIGGWVWNEGIGEKLGHTADHVQVGEQADYGYGIRVLLSGPRIPDKNLTPEQRQKVIATMTEFYDSFVERAAEARNKTSQEMHELAEGRVYSGDRGRRLGLVDEIGGLDAAILAAREAAGIGDDEEVTIVEYPTLPAFNPGVLSPLRPIHALLGWAKEPTDDAVQHPEWNYIRAVIGSPGRPLHMLPPDLYIYETELAH